MGAKVTAMRAIPIFLLICFFAIPISPAGDSAGDWLNKAADAKLSLREREYAARQVLMLADSSASILIGALQGEGADSGLRRQVAAGLLGELSSETAEAPLLEAAFEDEYFLAEAASAALARLYSRLDDVELHSLLKRGGRSPGTVPGGVREGDDWLVLSLDAAKGKSRFRALVMRGLELKYRNSPHPMPDPLAECVWDGLIDADAELRFHSLGAAVRTGVGRAAEKVAAFLYTENDPKLLTRALTAMAEMRPHGYAGAVERHVRHADSLVAIEALAALDAMGLGQRMFPAVPGERSIADFVAHPSTPIRRRAIGLLAESYNPAALEYLTAALFDRVGRNRAAAARALGELGFSGAIGGLSPLLNDSRPEVRAEAAVALSRLGVVGITARMTDDLEKAELPFRRAAAEALGRMGDPRAVSFLTFVLNDPDGELACLAAESLGKLKKSDAGAALFKAMGESGNPVLVDTARKALADIYLDDPGLSRSGWDAWKARNLARSGKHGN